MIPTSLQTDGSARVDRRAESSSPAPAASSSASVGDDSPSTPKEAARKFEKVLVHQFTKVMTENMFSNSLSGEGGGKWMESQRDRQRDHMTDMITEQLVESNSLGISEKLMQKWDATDEGPESPASVTPDIPLDLPAAPVELPSRLPPTSLNESQIDHAA